MLPIVWRPGARANLLALYDWIAEQADSDTAYDYTAAIEAGTTKLRDFPHQGSPRPDLGAGNRTLVHRRRTVIAYRVTAEAVEIVAVAHGGRDLGGAFGDEDA